MSDLRARGGFSLVEVIVAIVILSIGILAMAATTGYVFTRLRDSGVSTERMLAVQQAVEQVRAMPYSAVRDSSLIIGDYEISWDVDEPSSRMKQVVIVSVGPGYAGGEWSSTARDTVVIRLFKP